MGKRGPKKVPTSILKLRGSWRGNLYPNQPTPENKIPSKPEWLSAEAGEQWDYIAPKLFEQGVLTDWDSTALGLYCQAVVDYLEAHQAVNKFKKANQLLIKTNNGNIIQNPLIGIRNKAWQRVLKVSAEFGLTPSSRSSVSIKQPETSQPKAISRFFKAS